MALRIASTLLSTGLRASFVRSYSSSRSIRAHSEATETVPELKAELIPASVITYLDVLQKGQDIPELRAEFRKVAFGFDLAREVALVEEVDRRLASTTDAAVRERLQSAALLLKSAGDVAPPPQFGDDDMTEEEQLEEYGYVLNFDWAKKLLALEHPTLADAEAAHRHIVQMVRDYDASLVAQHPDMYVRAAYVAPYRADLYSEYNSVIEKIEKKHGVVFPTIVGAPRKFDDIVSDEDSPDYDEQAISEAAVWADYRPEELIACTAVQNEHTGLWEGKFRGEDVVFPECAPTLEWVCTTPVDAHLFEESPCVKVPEDELLE